MQQLNRPLIRTGVVVSIAIAAVATWMLASAPPPIVLNVQGSRPSYAMNQLLAHSDAVAIVSPIGDPTIHWNSPDNQPWAMGEFGRRSHIYSDQMFVVKEVVSGTLPEGGLMIRGVGGTVGNVTINYVDAPKPEIGASYLAFLDFRETPMKDGSELAWTVTWLEAGMFMETSGGWVNGNGKTLAFDLHDLKKD